MPSEVEEKAIKALAEFGGCTAARAKELLEAWKGVFAAEALGIVAGTEKVTTSVTDQRVERVKGLVDQLEAAPLPNRYELSVLLRVTPTQAGTVLRNWRARYPDHYEDHMKSLAAEGEHDTGGGGGSKATYVITYKNSDVLEYAVDCLRRKGLQQGLKVDRSALTIEIPQTTQDADKNDALKVLGI
jgi:hypothetical protein